MVGFGDNAGSGFPDILKVWSDNGWEVPELIEDTVMNQVTLTLRYQADEFENDVAVDLKMSEERTKKEQTERRLSEEGTEKEKTERRLSEEGTEKEKTERRLSAYLSKVLRQNDYQKVEKIIMFIEEYSYITPQIAGQITGKSASTVRRYMKMLTETGYVKVDGSTSNIKYIIQPIESKK